MPISCAHCGQPLSKRQRWDHNTYCSRQCLAAARQGEAGWCAWCGAPMPAWKASRQQTCSRACRWELHAEALRQQAKAEGLSPRCETCGALLRRQVQIDTGECETCRRTRIATARAARPQRPAGPSKPPLRAEWFQRLPGGLPKLQAMVEAMGARHTAERLGTTKNAVLGKLHRAGIRTRLAYAHRTALGLPGGNPMTSRRISHAHDSAERHAEMVRPLQGPGPDRAP